MRFLPGCDVQEKQSIFSTDLLKLILLKYLSSFMPLNEIGLIIAFSIEGRSRIALKIFSIAFDLFFEFIDKLHIKLGFYINGSNNPYRRCICFVF
jgi:hypothetical protein